MDKSISFTLLSPSFTKDTIGQHIETVTSRAVYGQITSVSASEFFAGGQNGFKPEYRITMFGPDYQGERRCEVDGVEYSIYRTYHGRTDEVELYLERRTGDHSDPEVDDVEDDLGAGQSDP